MLFGKDKASDSIIDRFHLLDYTIPFVAEATWGFKSGFCNGHPSSACLSLQIRQLGRTVHYEMSKKVYEKLEQELGVGNIVDMVGRDFKVYSQTSEDYDGMASFELDPYKLEHVCCIEPITGDSSKEEIRNSQKIFLLWQKYCNRSLNSEYELTRKDMADYFIIKFNILTNRDLYAKEESKRGSQQKAGKALEAVTKFNLFKNPERIA